MTNGYGHAEDSCFEHLEGPIVRGPWIWPPHVAEAVAEALIRPVADSGPDEDEDQQDDDGGVAEDDQGSRDHRGDDQA